MSDRMERVVTMTRCSDEPLHTGDRLDLANDATSHRLVVMRHHRVIGVLPEWLWIDVETWAAKSADGQDDIRLLPFTIEEDSHDGWTDDPRSEQEQVYRQIT